MENAPYQVGQVLALADTIHKDYCVVVRKGNLPNSLIGTGLMRRALDSPAAALADLAERMIEYLRWAKTAAPPKPPESSMPEQEQKRQRRMRRAYFETCDALKLYQPLAFNLANAVLPIECTDIMKAQLLLGFLASPPESGDDGAGKDGEK